MGSFNVDATLFSAAALFQSSEETRYYLNGVHIEPRADGGVFIVATDGHRMLVCHDETGTIEGGSVICRLGKDQLKACKPGRGEEGPRRVIASQGEPATVTDAAGTPVAIMPKWQIEGSFPDWRRAMAGADSAGGHDAFDSALFASFAAAGKLVAGNTRMRIETGSAGGPALIHFHAAGHVIGLLMPMRWDGGRGFPKFLDFEPRKPTVESEAA
ncbi:hypothetical protein NO932_11725 [Pelagibacterium sp. 26DY04]|uniref:DNA polymerase III subunit beta family protein n=1 Tax=Pelagibacterium sp. 26DY04 TaxID=2967130 RepID=UPI0028154E72|nr:hypothetical protein [Pelagibacterium sp. 26DY04]WMT85597.1 hypothetical protein NO932_11725 [Pelagibacterium sp. 26DY04]